MAVKLHSEMWENLHFDEFSMVHYTEVGYGPGTSIVWYEYFGTEEYSLVLCKHNTKHNCKTVLHLSRASCSFSGCKISLLFEK